MSIFKHVVVVGCIFSACATPPPHAKWAEKAAKSFSKSACDAHGFDSLGCGGNYSNQKVDLLYIDFELKKNITESEAKSLLVTTVEEFVVYINENIEIRPYLKVYPITPNEISASIAFVNHQREVEEGFSQIHLFSGSIYYSKYDQKKKEYTSYQNEAYPLKTIN